MKNRLILKRIKKDLKMREKNKIALSSVYWSEIFGWSFHFAWFRYW